MAENELVTGVMTVLLEVMLYIPIYNWFSGARLVDDPGLLRDLRFYTWDIPIYQLLNVTALQATCQHFLTSGHHPSMILNESE